MAWRASRSAHLHKNLTSCLFVCALSSCFETMFACIDLDCPSRSVCGGGVSAAARMCALALFSFFDFMCVCFLFLIVLYKIGSFREYGLCPFLGLRIG